MKDEITRLAREYTQETASLKDYQCQVKSAIYGRQLAKKLIEKKGYIEAICAELLPDTNIPIEETDPNDQTEYIWALVPEYNSHYQAKVVLRRVGTTNGELLLAHEKRAEKRLEMTEKERLHLKKQALKAIGQKIRNYESQIKTERGRLAEQIRNGDEAYMEACAIQLKRICDKMQEDLDDFLDLLVRP